MAFKFGKSGAGTTAAVLAAALLLTGCGGGSGSGEATAEDPVTIRFSWWGNDARARATQEVIAAFEAEHPHIKVQGENSEFSSYWDKMATQVAGGDAPDIFTMSGSYPSEYASRGVLLDLAEVKDLIDTGRFAEGTVELGRIDGKQYTVTAGVNAMAMVLDPAVFEQAGAELPDDEEWTWEDYVDLSARISAASPAGTFGTTPMINDHFLAVWARQHGEKLYNEDGDGVGISEDTMARYFAMNQELMENGGAPGASQTIEDNGVQPEQTLMGQGKQAMKLSWSNQMNAYSPEGELGMAKMPGESERGGAWLRSSMEYAISARTEHPKETAEFLNYLVNSEEAGKIIKTDRGMPANLDVREAVLPLLSENQQKEAAYLERIAEMDLEPPLPFPAGSSATMDVLNRQVAEVLFGRLTPEQAAKAFIAEMNTELGS